MRKIYSRSLDCVDESVFEVLDDLGVQQHLMGYNYIAYGLQYLIEHLPTGVSMTKDLYPSIARVFGSTSSRVERAIRHCISVTLQSVDPQVLHKYFGNSVKYDETSITNSQFLHTLTNYIRRTLRN